VEICGKNKQWIEGQCERFIRQVARYGFARLFERDAEEHPSEDGQPPRKGERMECSILWDGRDAKIVSGAAIRPLHRGDYTYPIRRYRARLQDGARRHRVEAAGRALSLRTIIRLDQEQEPQRAGGQAGSRGGLGAMKNPGLQAWGFAAMRVS
jgi:hypothetical protein